MRRHRDSCSDAICKFDCKLQYSNDPTIFPAWSIICKINCCKRQSFSFARTPTETTSSIKMKWKCVYTWFGYELRARLLWLNAFAFVSHNIFIVSIEYSVSVWLATAYSLFSFFCERWARHWAECVYMSNWPLCDTLRYEMLASDNGVRRRRNKIHEFKWMEWKWRRHARMSNSISIGILTFDRKYENSSTTISLALYVHHSMRYERVRAAYVRTNENKNQCHCQKEESKTINCYSYATTTR